jgi:hypothetical protein
MAKVIMEKLGLHITKQYKDLYIYYLNKVQCLCLIKDLVVNLAQDPNKSIMMEIIISDVPPNFGMLFQDRGVKNWETFSIRSIICNYTNVHLDHYLLRIIPWLKTKSYHEQGS